MNFVFLYSRSGLGTADFTEKWSPGGSTVSIAMEAGTQSAGGWWRPETRAYDMSASSSNMRKNATAFLEQVWTPLRILSLLLGISGFRIDGDGA